MGILGGRDLNVKRATAAAEGKKREKAVLLGIEKRVEVSGQVGAGPILGTDNFAVDAAFAVDNVGVRVHGGTVREWDFFGQVAIIRIGEMVGREEIPVGILVVVDADAKNGAAARRYPLLQEI